MNQGSGSPTPNVRAFDNRKRSDNYVERDNLPKQYGYHNKHRVLKQSSSLDPASHFGNNQYVSTNDSSARDSSDQQSPGIPPSESKKALNHHLYRRVRRSQDKYEEGVNAI